MLEVKNLTVKFKQNKDETIAINDCSLSFPNKGLIAIVGKSGSGKTTILNVLAGFISPTEGMYEIDGCDTSNLSNNEWEELRKNYFSFIFQNYNLIENTTVDNNLKLVCYEKEEADKEIDQALKLFDIFNLKNKNVCDLSGGEKQRVAIARAYIKNASVVLADEPTASLDEANSELVFSQLKKIAEDKLVIVVTHDNDLAEKYATKIIHIKYGKILLEPDEERFFPKQLNIKKSKINFSTIMYYKTIFTHKQKFRKIFSIIFSAILSILLTLCFYYSSFDKEFNEARIQTKYDGAIFLTSEEGNYIDKVSLNNVDIILNEYKKYVDVKKVYRYEFTLNQFFDTDSFLPIFENVIIDNDLADYDIIPSDYEVDNLKNVLAISSYEEAKGKELDVFGKKLYIKDIYDRKFYAKDQYIQDYLLSSSLADIVYMNETTLKYLLNCTNAKIESFDNKGQSFILLNENKCADLSLSWGNSNIDAENEIVLTTGALYKLADVSYYEDQEQQYEEIKKYVNTYVDLDLYFDDKNIKGSFKIKGIIPSGECEIYFSSNLLNQEELQLKEADNYSLSFSNEKKAKEIINKLHDKKIYLLSEATFSIMETNSYIKVVGNLFVYASIIVFFMLLLMIYFFAKLTIKMNYKNIGIGKSLGIGDKEFGLIYGIDSLFDSFVITFISIIGSSIIILILNILSIKGDIYSQGLFVFSPLIHIVVFIILIIISLFSLLISYSRIKKIDIIELMKK